jgi:hypothetical protein
MLPDAEKARDSSQKVPPVLGLSSFFRDKDFEGRRISRLSRCGSEKGATRAYRPSLLKPQTMAPLRGLRGLLCCNYGTYGSRESRRTHARPARAPISHT